MIEEKPLSGRQRRKKRKNVRRRERINAQRGNFTNTLFKQICRQFDQRCFYCSVKLTGGQALDQNGKRKCIPTHRTKDHLISLRKGGTHSIDNIVPACLRCNNWKGEDPPETFFPLLISLLKQQDNKEILENTQANFVRYMILGYEVQLDG